MWFHGNYDIPPLKYVHSKDPSENHVVYGRSRPVMETEVRYLNRMNVRKTFNNSAIIGARNVPNINELVTMYIQEHIKAVLPPETTENNRTRRVDQL
jgi:hypothetical protein